MSLRMNTIRDTLTHRRYLSSHAGYGECSETGGGCGGDGEDVADRQPGYHPADRSDDGEGDRGALAAPVEESSTATQWVAGTPRSLVAVE